MRYGIVSLLIATALVPTARGQANAVASSADSVFARAKQLVLSGNGAAGRVLVDSLVAAATPNTPEYADALYWRASLAGSADDAERDFRRVVVEYPLSRRAGDALWQLAQLEVARGDRAPALTHLERFLIENPKDPDRNRAGLMLMRVAFEQNQPVIGCTFLGRLLGDIPDVEVELRNQFTYYSPRCAGVDTVRANTVATVATPEPAPAKTDTAVRAKAKFTLQLAAYATRADAERLVTRLKDRGLDARVVGTSKTFRVKVGRYVTRAEAAAAAKQLKAKKIDAFVTEITADDK